MKPIYKYRSMEINKEYKEPYNKKYKVIIWFWEIMNHLNQNQLLN